MISAEGHTLRWRCECVRIKETSSSNARPTRLHSATESAAIVLIDASSGPNDQSTKQAFAGTETMGIWHGIRATTHRNVEQCGACRSKMLALFFCPRVTH